jgi:transglutaminase-like putative cysteine protease
MKGEWDLPIGRPLLASLMLLLTAAAAPHFLHLSSWISLFFLAAVGARTLFLLRGWRLPGSFVLLLLALVGVGNVLFNYPVIFSGETTIALMTSMVGLKLLELRSRRDLYIVVFVGYFLLVTQLLFQEGMLMLGYVFLVALGLTAVLVEANRIEPSRTPLRPLITAASLLAQSLPLMLVLFVFFPRLAGPIWSLTGPAQGSTGMSDRIAPGSISELALSREVAFRADFDGPLPPSPQRYWRGPVLWDNNGRSWNSGAPLPGLANRVTTFGPPLHYTVTLEPTDQRWLFALDLPMSVPEGAVQLPDYQLRRLQPVSSRILYRASSQLRYNTGALSEAERQRGLQLPDNITPRMRALVAQWESQGGNRASIVLQALRYFRQEPFYYTLNPPPLAENPVDQFLFESRRGFCEHYASAFATLMRIAGIPTRVVVGYQGGEYNPMGGYLIIRQSDAHAWNEVWLTGQGWVRIDPTAAVAPERIEQTFEFDPATAFAAVGTPIRFEIEATWAQGILRRFRWGVDAVNASWHRWVLGYTQKRQSQLMDLLGLGFLHRRGLAIAMILFTSVVVAVLGTLIWRQGRQLVDPVQKEYLRFCNRLKRRGLARRANEGPLDYGERIARRWPEHRATATRILRLYIKLRYGGADSREGRVRFRQLARAFKP